MNLTTDFSTKKSNVRFSATASDKCVKICFDWDKDLKYQLCKLGESEERIWLTNNTYIDCDVESGKEYCYTLNAYFGNNLIYSSKTIKITMPTEEKTDTNNGTTPNKDFWQDLKNLLYFGKN